MNVPPHATNIHHTLNLTNHASYKRINSLHYHCLGCCIILYLYQIAFGFIIDIVTVFTAVG